MFSPESINTPSLVFSPSEQLETTPGVSLNATWEMWDLIRSICDYNPRLTLSKNVILWLILAPLNHLLLALDLSPALPTTLGVLSKWTAESVRHIFLPSSTFIANVKGYPVLPKPTQQFIRDSMIASLSYCFQDNFPTIIYVASSSDYPFGNECWEAFSWRRSCIFPICSPSGKN